MCDAVASFTMCIEDVLVRSHEVSCLLHIRAALKNGMVHRVGFLECLVHLLPDVPALVQVHQSLALYRLFNFERGGRCSAGNLGCRV